jgi:hypothetical protein
LASSETERLKYSSRRPSGFWTAKGLGIPERIEDVSESVDPEDLRAVLEWLCGLFDAERVAEMEVTIGFDPMPEMAEGEVVLYGFEGQVDLVRSVPDRPRYLLVPLRPRLRYTDVGVEPWDWDGVYRTARYDRVGENTYVRVE